MKKFLIITLIIILNSCGGYQPMFAGKEMDFYIEKIKNIKNDDISIKIIKKLVPYTNNTNKKKIELEIESSVAERVVSKDSKGDPLVFEIEIQTYISILNAGIKSNFIYKENFSFNNQSNKFELKQYKKNIKNNLIDQIVEKLIIELRSI
jgi:hypothetical protein